MDEKTWIDDSPSRLREARDEDGVPQEVLAQLIGCSAQTIRRAENGHRSTTGQVAVDLYRYSIRRVRAVKDMHGRWFLQRQDHDVLRQEIRRLKARIDFIRDACDMPLSRPPLLIPGEYPDVTRKDVYAHTERLTSGDEPHTLSHMPRSASSDYPGEVAKPTTVRLYPSQISALKDIARERGVSESDVIREALEAVISEFDQ